MRFWRRRELSEAEGDVLIALVEGWTLKSHRTLDGDKRYLLHALHGEQIEITPSVVERLSARRFVQSNQKFPAATLLLTEKGRAAAKRLSSDTRSPAFPWNR